MAECDKPPNLNVSYQFFFVVVVASFALFLIYGIIIRIRSRILKWVGFILFKFSYALGEQVP